MNSVLWRKHTPHRHKLPDNKADKTRDRKVIKYGLKPNHKNIWVWVDQPYENIWVFMQTYKKINILHKYNKNNIFYFMA